MYISVCSIVRGKQLGPVRFELLDTHRHPRLCLLDREDIHDRAFIEDETILPPSPNMDDEAISDGEIDADISSLAEAELSSHPTPVCMNTVPIDREMQARRLVARPRQPFGALLVALASMGRRAVVYRRVAADSLITVEFKEDVSLADILDNVRTLDVL
ncbi:hypothetical protein EV363DRAFT_1168328 [Boletus edulis]|nr:hypothetical protein EV363DRAFT_1168328 [Boletus edulis]